jgi:hypothetical protein
MDGRGTQSFIKFCPACKLGNDANAVNCKHCGASLDLTSARSSPGEKDAQGAREYSIPSDGVAFYFSGITTPIAVTTDEEFILGRKTEGESEPLVDLTNPDGFAMGVSRRHAMVRAAGNGYVIIDLNSSNGTWVDGKILVPTQQYDLPSGGLIQLGRLKLVAIYNSPAGGR